MGEPGGNAHGSSGKRTIRSNVDNLTLSSLDSTGEFPVGTIILKEVENGSKIVAMVKRGNDFAPDHNDWEWFNLDPNNAVITVRGDRSGCTGCHSDAKGIDYTFSVK